MGALWVTMAEYQTAFTVENLMALEKALVDGVRRVKYADKEMEYRSLDEMKDLVNAMKKSLGMGKTCGKPGLFGGRRIIGRHSKDLD